jgi:hypothetical protein
MAPLLAVCCALGVLLFRRIGATASQRYPNLAGSVFALGLTLFLSYYCWMGTRYYYAIRWQHPQKIAALKWLNQQIPADKPLLSFRSFIVDQHSSKGAFLRPEIAWYLDRPVQVPMSMEEIAAEFQRAGARGGGQRWQFEQTAEAIVRAARRAHEETGAPFFLMLGNPQAVVQPDRRAGFFDRLAHFMARKLPVANLYPGRSGQKGGWGSPGRVGMVPWTIFDLREPQPTTGRATPLPE